MSRMTRSRSHSSGTRLNPANKELFRAAKLDKEVVQDTETAKPDDGKAPVAILPAQPLTTNLLTPQEEFWNLKLVVGFTALLASYFGICEPPFLQAICAAAAVAVACGLLLIDEENCAATRQFDKK